jgi:hypothetical protein
MTRHRLALWLRLSIAAAALLVMAATPGAAQEHPINVALVTPIQIFPADQPIKGLRLNVIYGRNSAMTGLDVGIANHVAGRMSGVQWGVVNLADSMVGWQAGTVNYTAGRFEGLMWGPVNYAGHINGLQLGIVNYAARASGIQIGLINIIKKGGQFPVMVIANWGKSRP